MNQSFSTITAHVPTELISKLNILVKEHERTKTYFIKKALEKYIAEEMELINEYKIAEKRYQEFKDSGEEGISLEEMEKREGII